MIFHVLSMFMTGITVTRRNGNLLACKTAQPEDSERIRHEAQLLKRLEHPGIVQFVDFIEEPSVELYLAFVGPDSWQPSLPALPPSRWKPWPQLRQRSLISTASEPCTGHCVLNMCSWRPTSDQSCAD